MYFNADILHDEVQDSDYFLRSNSLTTAPKHAFLPNDSSTTHFFHIQAAEDTSIVFTIPFEAAGDRCSSSETQQALLTHQNWYLYHELDPH